VPDTPRRESELMHRLRNHLAVVVTFSELLVLELPEDDPRRKDLVEIQKAGKAAMEMMPEIAKFVP
jgi:hypothetical protein